MLMPVPIIWRLKMSAKKKIGVTSVFMVGILYVLSHIIPWKFGLGIPGAKT